MNGKLLKLALLGALVTLANGNPSNNGFLNIYMQPNEQNGQLVLSDAKDGAYIGVSLKNAITSEYSTAMVSIVSGSGVRVSNCFLQFDASNWDKTQQLYIDGQALFDGETVSADRQGLSALKPCVTRDYSIKFVLDGAEQTLSIRRDVCIGKGAYVWGDPHIRTFNDKLVEWQEAGPYYLVKSDRLVIQAQLFACNTAVTCAGAFAVQYLDNVFLVSALPNTTKTEIGNFMFLGTKVDKVCLYQQNNNNRFWQLNLPDSTNLQMESAWWNGWYYMNMWTNLPARYSGKIGGLLNDFHAAAGEGYLARYGVESDMRNFALSWKVPDNENLFKRCDKSSTCTADPALFNSPNVRPATFEFCNQNGATMTNTPSYGTTSVTNTTDNAAKCPNVNGYYRLTNTTMAPYDTAFTTPELQKYNRFMTWTDIAKTYGIPLRKRAENPDPANFLRDATKVCTDSLTIPDCTSDPVNLNAGNVIQECISDALVGGTLDHVDSYKVQMMRRCAKILESIAVNTKDAAELTKIAAIQTKLGFQTGICPQFNGTTCNSKGTCISGVCICYEYTGSACETELASIPQPARGGYPGWNPPVWGPFEAPKVPTAFAADVTAAMKKSAAENLNVQMSLVLVVLSSLFVLFL